MADLSITKGRIKNIIRNLEDVEKTLKKARNWGIYDIIGGSSITSVIKHSKISKAEGKLNSVKKEIFILQEELSELNIPIPNKINTSTFNKFLDIFSDNIFSDLFTQSNINKGLDNITQLKLDLTFLYNNLNE